MARRELTLRLLEPVTVRGRTIAALRLVEPTARDFVEIGPAVLVHRRGGLVVRLDIPGRVEGYVRRIAPDLRPDEIGPLLAAMGLADAMRLKAAIGGFLFDARREDVDALTAALAFDFKLMPLDAADALGLAELAYTCRRLGEHFKRRAAAAKGG